MIAQNPLIITSYLGRNTGAVSKLVELSEKLAIPVLQSCPSAVNFPHSHPNFVDLSFGIGENEWVRNADIILIIDSDIPYIPLHNKPHPNAVIIHIDVDVLKDNMGTFHVDAGIRCKADAEVALGQILEHLNAADLDTDDAGIRGRARSLVANHNIRIKALDSAELEFPTDGSFTVPNILGVLRKSVPRRTLFLNEGISNYPFVWNHLRPDEPGSMFSSGASSLGWGLGAAIGASLGGRTLGKEHELIVLVVGDGSFLFGVPSSAYWIARRYDTVSWRFPPLTLGGLLT